MKDEGRAQGGKRRRWRHKVGREGCGGTGWEEKEVEAQGEMRRMTLRERE